MNMQAIENIIGKIDSFVWGPPMLILLVGVHVFLTFRLKFIQRYIPMAIKISFTSDKKAGGDISHFGALAIALAATIGTGNIIGVATAIVCGGPGAVFWCWFCGVFGIATKYAEAVLAIKYRIVGKDGLIRGGPMYAMERGMKCKWLGILFAVFTLLSCCGIGSMTQSNAVAETVLKTFNIPVWITGLGEMLLIILVVFGGLNFISKVCGMLVPAMAILYTAGCLAVIGLNYQTVIPALQLIFHEAFNIKAAGGGLLGSVMIMAIRYGVARGLFSNESGLGSAPLIAASARTSNPVRQALISSTGTFWDTVCICALTGIAVVSSALYADPHFDFSKMNAAELTCNAFGRIPYVGQYILAICLAVFAYTTILGWFCYGRQAIHYLSGEKTFTIFRIVYVALVFAGAVASLSVVWNISDIANGLMALPNIICLFALSGVVVAETRKYLWSGKLDDVDPECIKINQSGESISEENEIKP